MTQTIQYDKNPSAEGAAARVSRASATPSLSTDVFTSWPPLGTRSHKLVATATTVATVGMPNADRPAAAAGQKWSASVRVRSSQARTCQVAIVFYNTAGATLGTTLLTVPTSASFTAGEIKTLTVNGAVAPASTASVDLQVSRNAGGGAAISDAVHFDMVSLTRTDIAVEYRDPDTDVFATWSGAANTSTQVYWTPALTCTPLTDASPAPRILVLVDDLPPGVTTLTLYRTAEGRTMKVRGAVEVGVSSGFQIPDVEAPFQVQSAYRAQMFASGVDAGYTVTASAILDVDVTWVHNPLAPGDSVVIDLSNDSGMALTRPVSGEMFYPEQRTVAVLITGRRLGLQGVQLFFSTDQPDVAAKFEAMFGGYNDDDQTVPVLCVRTPPVIDIPRTFFAGTLRPTRRPINAHMGGTLKEWDVKADEAAPPFPGIVVALLTRDDIDAFFSTRNSLDAAYASRLAIDRDYAKAGTA